MQQFWTTTYAHETRWQRFTRRLLRRKRPVESVHHHLLTLDGTSFNFYQDGRLVSHGTDMRGFDHALSHQEILALYQQGPENESPSANQPA